MTEQITEQMTEQEKCALMFLCGREASTAHEVKKALSRVGISSEDALDGINRLLSDGKISMSNRSILFFNKDDDLEFRKKGLSFIEKLFSLRMKTKEKSKAKFIPFSEESYACIEVSTSEFTKDFCCYSTEERETFVYTLLDLLSDYSEYHRGEYPLEVSQALRFLSSYTGEPSRTIKPKKKKTKKATGDSKDSDQ